MSRNYFEDCYKIDFEKNQLQNNYFFADASALAYRGEIFAKEQYANIGYKTHFYLNIAGAQGHIAANNKNIIISFRGTEPKEINDLYADVKFGKRKAKLGGEGWVHSGFQGEVDKLFPTVLQCIPKQTNKKIYITGHSLGGAMATVCASRLEHLNPTLYTYGSPRVGGSWFVRGLKVEHHRFVNNNDLVPGFPLWIMGYAHHGSLVYINHYGNIRKMTYWQRFKDKLRGRWAAMKKKQFFDGLVDHSIGLYADKLKKVYKDSL